MPCTPGAPTAMNWPASNSHGAHRAGARHDARGAGLDRIDEARHLDRHVAFGRALAHQELARVGLQVLAPWGARPAVGDPALDQLGLAGAAGPGGALVGQ